MVKYHITIKQALDIYRYLLNYDEIKDSIISSSFWLNGFSMTIKDKDGKVKFFDFIQKPALKDDYFYVRGDYQEIEKIILKYIHDKGSSGEEDWSVSFE